MATETKTATVIVQGLPLYLKDLALAALKAKFPQFGEGEKVRPAEYVTSEYGEYCGISNLGNVPKATIKLMEVLVAGIQWAIENAPPTTTTLPVPETA